MKNKFLSLAAFSLLAFGMSNSFAGEIAVLDIEKIAKESKAVHYIQAKVSKKQDEF